MNSNNAKYGSITVEDRQGLLPHTTAMTANDVDSGSSTRSVIPYKKLLGVAVVLIGVVLLIVVRSSSSATAADSGAESPLNMAEAVFYLDQLVDHHHRDTTTSTQSSSEDNNNNAPKYAQRYYEKKKYFGGPGSPIFLILGGEDELDGLLYPFIHEVLAQKYSAVTFALEHRFFGESFPILHPTNADLAQLLLPSQALNDAVRFIQHKRVQLGCSLDKTQVSRYCPVMTVGGSYPGFLSALMRLAHADTIDIAYASSAPLNLYSHHVDPFAYYEKITNEAELASPGCSTAVKRVLHHVQTTLLDTKQHYDADDIARTYGICPGTIPNYIKNTQTFVDELVMVLATHFAEYNMMYYPPGPQQDLVKACDIFEANKRHPERAIQKALNEMAGTKCYDLQGIELPEGPNATISASDWSGVGSGPASVYWEFLSCQLLSPTGFSESSMFPQREWSFAWEKKHCYDRFEWKITPDALEEEFHFDDRSNVTHLLLANGLVDGWSVASILESDVPGVAVVNMEHGAHHSDLDHHGPTDRDTPDVKAAFEKISAIIGDWLDEIKGEAS